LLANGTGGWKPVTKTAKTEKWENCGLSPSPEVPGENIEKYAA